MSSSTRQTNTRPWSTRLWRLAYAALMLALPCAVRGEAPPVPLPSPALARMTGADLGVLFDGLVPAQLARNDIAGAVVTVVRGGRIVFAKGYGYADVGRRAPVSATGTLFRIGSVSKLMTWTAVMQLVEQGRIDLSADVNQYLDFRLPDPFGKPVTMRHLMTHTAGFEDAFQGVWRQAPDPGEYLELKVAMRIPKRIFAPGTVAAYSNYGAALAGYIVQRVSGEPFDAYVERHITRPLAMAHTTFVQPLPAALAPHMSSGYRLASGGAMPFELMLSPAGGAAATATDMARFMLANLGDGSVDGVRILQQETMSLMHSPQHAFDARDNATTLGWVSLQRNGQRLLGHDGATFYFHSNLVLVPDAGVGIFIAYNSSGNGNGGTSGAVIRAFMDRYFPYSPPAVATLPDAGTRGMAGYYMPSRRGETNLSYLAAMFGQTWVAENGDGTIEVGKLMEAGRPATAWRETAPGYWQDSARQQRHLIFRQDKAGGWQFSDGNPGSVHQRVAWFQDQRLSMALLVFSIAVSAASLAAWPVAAWRGRRHPAHRLAHLGAAINLLMWGSAAGLAAFAATHIELLPAAWFDTSLRILQLGGWCGVLAIAWLAWRARQVRRGMTASFWAGVHQWLVWAACLASLWIGVQANMFALTLHY
ncbi:MAG: serine hydrolase domain-containing protein [Telluria sp.]